MRKDFVLSCEPPFMEEDDMDDLLLSSVEKVHHRLEGRVWNLPTWLSPKLVNREDMVGGLIRSWGWSEEGFGEETVGVHARGQEFGSPKPI